MGLIVFRIISSKSTTNCENKLSDIRPRNLKIWCSSRLRALSSTLSTLYKWNSRNCYKVYAEFNIWSQHTWLCRWPLTLSSCTTESRETCSLNLERCCKTILDWFSQNKLKANPDKFQFIIYGTKQQHKNIPTHLKSITINETSLKATSVVTCYLVKISEELLRMHSTPQLYRK